jgi:uncharacterized protein YqgV (UPF0045/DUF77 family)
LRQPRLSPAIAAGTDALEAAGLETTVGPMSTSVVGEAPPLFDALREGFARAAALGPVVLQITLSYACPVAPPSGP